MFIFKAYQQSIFHFWHAVIVLLFDAVVIFEKFYGYKARQRIARHKNTENKSFKKTT